MLSIPIYGHAKRETNSFPNTKRERSEIPPSEQRLEMFFFFFFNTILLIKSSWLLIIKFAKGARPLLKDPSRFVMVMKTSGRPIS